MSSPGQVSMRSNTLGAVLVEPELTSFHRNPGQHLVTPTTSTTSPTSPVAEEPGPISHVDGFDEYEPMGNDYLEEDDSHVGEENLSALDPVAVQGTEPFGTELKSSDQGLTEVNVRKTCRFRRWHNLTNLRPYGPIAITGSPVHDKTIRFSFHDSRKITCPTRPYRTINVFHRPAGYHM